jgi:hypothetical protein
VVTSQKRRTHTRAKESFAFCSRWDHFGNPIGQGYGCDAQDVHYVAFKRNGSRPWGKADRKCSLRNDDMII